MPSEFSIRSGYHEYETSRGPQEPPSGPYRGQPPAIFHSAQTENSPVYLIEPPNRGDDVGVMASRIKKAGYGRYRSFTPEEDARLSAADAIRQVAVSSGVFIPFQTPTIQGAVIHNIRCMFIAGLADGMGKPKLVLVPSGYDAPLDVRATTPRLGTNSPTFTITLRSSVPASLSTEVRSSPPASTA